MLKTSRVIVISCSLLMLLMMNLHAGMAETPPATAPCQPFKIGIDTSRLPEIQGVSDTQTLWALLFPYHLPVWSNEDLKIVWRMTGTGNFSLKVQGADGTVIQPIWGPVEHGGSSWDRPGEEWGTGLNFPEAGCWRILVQRGTDTGEIDLLVVPNHPILF